LRGEDAMRIKLLVSIGVALALTLLAAVALLGLPRPVGLGSS